MPLTINPSFETDNGILPTRAASSDRTIILSGTADVGQEVRIYDGDNQIGTATRDGGTWRFVTDALSDGWHPLTAQMLAADGSLLDTSRVSVNIYTPGTVASVRGAVWVEGAENNWIEDGGITSHQKFTLVGSGEPGDVIEVFSGQNPIGSFTIGAADVPGLSWQFVTPTLPDGPHGLNVLITHQDGSSFRSSTIGITVDTVLEQASFDSLIGIGSGFIASGATTNADTLHFSGQAEAGASVEIFDNGSLIGRVVGEGTAWHFTANGLTNGLHQLYATITDQAGNAATTQAVEVTIDRLAPEGDINGSLLVGGAGGSAIENGSSTNQQVFTLTGVAEAGANVLIFDGEQALGPATLDGTAWNFTTPLLADGQHDFRAQITDSVGNLTTSSTVSVIVDTQITAATIDASIGTDTGAVASILSNGLTRDATLALSGTAETGAWVTVLDGETPIGIVQAVDGGWQFISGPLIHGLHTLSAVVSDAVGNSARTGVIDVNIDTQIAAPGISDWLGQDGVRILQGQPTRSTNLVMTGTAEPGSRIELFDGATFLGLAEVTGTAWRFTTPALADGQHGLFARASDLAGNVADSASLNIIVDTTVGRASIHPLILTDTGATASILNGGITKDSTLTISGEAETGAHVTIFVDQTPFGSVIATDGAWQFVMPALSDGPYALFARITDLAGNTIDTPVLNAIIDTWVESVTISDLIGTDSGLWPSIVSGESTRDRTIDLSGSAEPGATVDVFDGQTLLGAAILEGDAWRFVTPELADGPHALRARVTDGAGNVRETEVLNFGIDTEVSEASINPLIGTDSGATSSITAGGITRDKTLALSGRAETGSIVRIFDGATQLGNATLVGSDWHFVTRELADGLHGLFARVSDPAGVFRDSETVNITTDTRVSVASISNVMGTDTGLTASISSSMTTRDTTLALSGSVEAGASVDVYDGDVRLGAATVVGDQWQFLTPALTDNLHSLAARVTDAAGNVATTSTVFAVIDTWINLIGTNPVIKTDTGLTPTITSGGTTRDNTLSLDGGAESRSSIDIFDGQTYLGAAKLVANGWDFTTPALADGTHTLIARVTDPSGNTADAAPVSVTIDTRVSAASISSTIGTKTGLTPTITSGATTRDANLVLSGSAEPFSTIEVFDGTVRLGTARQDGGTWQFSTPVLAEGAHAFTARVTDSAGNVANTAAVNATIDTRVSSASISNLIGTDSGLTPTITNGGTTKDASLRLSGEAEAGATVELFDGQTRLGAASLDGTSWNFVTPVLADGSHTLTAKVTDAAGNVITTEPVSVTIDTRVSAASISNLIGTDTGRTLITSNGVTTKDASLSLSGTAEAGALVELFDGQTRLGAATLSNGEWRFTTPTLADGAHALTAKITDIAGNVATTTAVSAIIDTQPSLASVSPVILTNAGKTGTIQSGGTTRDNTLGFSGTGEPGSTVKLFTANTAEPFAVIIADQNWTYNTNTLADGRYEFFASTTDIAGNDTPAFSIGTVTIDTRVSVASISNVIGTNRGYTSTINSGGTTKDNTLGLGGYAEPGATVTLFDVTDGMIRLAEVISRDGEWSYNTRPLADGTRAFYAEVTDLAGNVVRTNTVTAHIDTVVSQASMNVVAHRSGGTIFTSDNSALVKNGIVALAGTAEHGATVEILDGTRSLATLTAGDGNWQFETRELTQGEHVLSARITDVAGNVAQTAARYVALSPAIYIASMSDTIGTNTGATATINNGGITRDTSLDLSGTADAGSLVQVYSGDDLLGNATLSGTNWTYTAAPRYIFGVYGGEFEGLLDGTHQLRAKVSDAFGNVAWTNTVTANVKSYMYPASMNSVIATNTGISASIVHGGLTRDATVGLSGQAEAGVTVRIEDGDRVLGNAEMNGTTWQFTTPQLSDGWHNLRAVMTDAAGNVRSPTGVSLNVDTRVSTATIESQIEVNDGGKVRLVDGNAYVKDPALKLRGSAELGARVELFDGERSLGMANIDANGNWSHTTPTLAKGQHALFARVTDVAGNSLNTAILNPVVTPYLGNSGNNKLSGTTGNDTLFGGGGVDTIVGGAGDDRIVLPDWRSARMDGGAGRDTLEMTGGGQALDLQQMSGKLSGVEVFDIGGSGANTIMLDFASAVRQLGATRSGQQLSLTILGDANDLVTLFGNGAHWIAYGADGPAGVEEYRAYGSVGSLTNLELVVKIGLAVGTVELL